MKTIISLVLIGLIVFVAVMLPFFIFFIIGTIFDEIDIKNNRHRPIKDRTKKHPKIL
jgi:hypothetical protein